MCSDKLRKLTYDNHKKSFDILSHDLKTILRHELQQSYEKS